MAKYELYSPRRLTEDNAGSLPSTHTPDTKVTYVQIHLNEQEMAEAIRNYIRASHPGTEGQELPVEMIAGRKGKGHTAKVTFDPVAVPVTYAELPKEFTQEFEELTTKAAEMSEEPVVVTEEPEAVEPDAPVEAPVEEAAPVTETAAPEATDPIVEEEAAPERTDTTAPEPIPEPVEAAPVKTASSLFGSPEPVAAGVPEGQTTTTRSSLFD